MLRGILSLCFVGLVGCAGRAVYVVDDGPPTPRTETVVYRPGHVWVQGHWHRSGASWVWRDGYYERERPNMIYVSGRWERAGHRWVWREGGWRARGGVVIRDSRRF